MADWRAILETFPPTEDLKLPTEAKGSDGKCCPVETVLYWLTASSGSPRDLLEGGVLFRREWLARALASVQEPAGETTYLCPWCPAVFRGEDDSAVQVHYEKTHGAEIQRMIEALALAAEAGEGE